MEKVFIACCNLNGNRYSRKVCKYNINANGGESVLSTKTRKILHWPFEIPSTFNANTTTFLFTVRNPISRLVSAFNMHHPSNTHNTGDNNGANYFYSCFPTIQHLANTLQNHDKGLSVMNVNNESVNCFQLGKDTLTGRPPEQPCAADYTSAKHYEKMKYVYENNAGLACGHCYGNYDKYTKYTLQQYPDKEVFAIRTEQLWNDTHNLNVALGGREDAFEHITNHRFTHGSQAYQVSVGLTKLGKATICCFIYEEIALYEQIIKRAVNLLEDEKNEALASLYEDCGITNRDDGDFRWNVWAETHNCL